MYKHYMDPKKLITLAIALLVTGALWGALQNSFKKEPVRFLLNGESTITLEYGEEYTEKGAVVYLDQEDKSKEISINNKNFNNKKVGIYEVTYSYLSPKQKIYTITRQIIIKDSKKPEIELLGRDPYVLEIGTPYEEPGIIVTDNYDLDVKNKVTSTNNIDHLTIGSYEIIYTAIDSSNNTATKSRKVEVVSKKENVASERNQASATITNLGFTENGFYLEFTSKNVIEQVGLISNDNDLIKLGVPSKVGTGTYRVVMPLPKLENKTYTFYIRKPGVENFVIGVDPVKRIIRRNLKDKFLTMDYSSNRVSFKVEDMNYQYDIVIDPGHGGSDTGTSDKTSRVQEKDVNLMQSLYEKKRYEEHGLRVFMLRENDTYGVLMGPSDWSLVSRRSYAIGYYGSVSKITYSNHHNWSDNDQKKGWMIIVPSASSKEELLVPFNVKSAWEKSYPVETETPRFYTRDVSDGAIYDKSQGQVYYSFINYYAVNRFPQDLFRVNNVLYEGSYFSNEEDLNWYYYQENWKKQSEEKIKCYVEYLGKEYLPPK